jgi:hypothetical protein
MWGRRKQVVNHPNRHGKAAIVTTTHRGVFFGYLNEYTPGDAIVHLKQARCCISWPTEQRGFVGLASDGPKRGARIGPAALEMELRDITAVLICSDEAVKAWESAPWN